MSTSTLASVLNSTVGTAWEYITTLLGTVMPYAVGIGVLGGGIYFILRRLKIV